MRNAWSSGAGVTYNETVPECRKRYAGIAIDLSAVGYD